MDRRRLLFLCGLGVVSSLSGCSRVFGRVFRSPQTPGGMTVETATWSAGHLHTRGRDNPYAVVVTSTDAATNELRRLRDSDEDLDPIEFVDQTEFERSYLILIEWTGTSGTASFELRRIERRDYGLHIKTVIRRNAASSNDVSPHTLFIRVTDNREDPPARLTVDIDD